MTSRPHRVVIVGGGISGLALAHRLMERRRSHSAALDVTLLEAGPRFGGVIRTERRDGLLCEAGPDAFMAEQPWMTDLCRRLGIDDHMIPTQPSFRRSFIARRGRLLPVPEGWYLMAPMTWRAAFRMPLLSWRGKLRAACERFIPPSTGLGDESVAGFITRRFGRETLDRIGQPMMAGIYGGDAQQLSLGATLPTFAELERRHGSVLSGLRHRARRDATTALESAGGPRYALFFSFRDGMDTLIQALVSRLADVRLQCRSSVTRIERSPGGWIAHLDDGSRCEADSLCLALPAPRAARVLASHAPELSQELMTIPYEFAATVNLAARANEIPRPLTGFGVVVPASERRRILGCTFSSVKFSGRAPHATVLLRAFVGGALHHGVEALDDQALEQLVRDDLRDLLGLRAVPSLVSIARHRYAMPQYVIGHLERVASIESHTRRYPGLFLTGNGYRGIGLPECVHQAEQIAERIIANGR